MTKSETKKIMWLSPMCSLDRRSGAAQQIHAVLSTLVDSGWEAHAVEMTLFDGKEPYPVSTIVGNQLATPECHGKTFKLYNEGIHHLLYFTQSTFGKNLTDEEARIFLSRAKQTLHQIQPDVVITYGGSPLSRALIKAAKESCKYLVFFLANPSYDDPELFRPVDQVLVNSHFTRNYYKKKLGIESKVLPEVLPSSVLIEPNEVFPARDPSKRSFGFITMINPSFVKGATLFARLVKMAYRERPEWTFLAVEGRMTDDQWAQAGVDLANQPNVFWIPNQQDMRRVYARTSILLFPSFVEETAGRVGVEASLGGIPVLASNHGGIPEMLNGAGFLFDIPAKCREKFITVPSEAEVHPWLNKLSELMDCEDSYRRASERAVECASLRHPQQAKEKVVQIFRDIFQGQNIIPPLLHRQNKRNNSTGKKQKTGRNDPCTCGSEKKAKHCCGTEPQTATQFEATD